MKPLRLFFFLLGCIAFSSVMGQEYSMNIRTLSVEDGLTTRYPKAIFQDAEGFVWNINSTGSSGDFNLDRFDGKEFKHFPLVVNRPDWNSPILFRAFEGFDQRFWLYRAFTLDAYGHSIDDRRRNSVFFAIDVFDPKTGVAIPLDEYLDYQLPFQANMASTLSVGKDNAMLVGTAGGTIYELKNDDYALKYQITGNKIVSQIISVDDGYWIALNDRFIKLDNQWLEVKGFMNNTAMQMDTVNGWQYRNIREPVLSAFQDQDSNLHYIAFQSNVSTRCNEIQTRSYFINEVQQNTPDDLDFIAISANADVRYAFRKDGKRNISIVAIDKNGNVLAEQPTDIASINASYFDRDQNLWLSTDNGMVLVQLKRELFKKYLNNQVTYLSEWFQTRGIVQTNDSTLWVGGLGKLRQLNLKTEVSRTFDGQVLTRDLQLIDESLWLSEEASKIFQLDPKTNEVIYYDFTEEDKAKEITGKPTPVGHWKIHKDMWGNLWAGSRKGLTIIDPNSRTLSHLPNTGAMQALDSADVIDIHENNQGMWLATTKGVYLFDPVKRAILAHYHREAEERQRLPHNDIAHIY